MLCAAAVALKCLAVVPHMLPPALQAGIMVHYLSEEWRAAAVKCYWAACTNLPLAVIFFNEMVPEHTVANPIEFIKYWADAFDERHSVLTKKPSGPEPSISPEQARECVRLLEAGYTSSRGKQKYFHSLRQACRKSPGLAAVLEEHKIHQDSLLRRMRAAEPKLCRRMLRFLRQLKPSHKRERRRYSKVLLDLHKLEAKGAALKRLLARCVWLDSKVVYVVPKGMLVYAPKGADLYVEDARLPQSRYAIKKINYYVAVNWVLGPVYFQVMTGTTGFKSMTDLYKAYKVGTAAGAFACTPASKTYECVCHTNEQWGLSFTAFTASCIRLAHCRLSSKCRRSRRSLCFLHSASSCLSRWYCAAAALLCISPLKCCLPSTSTAIIHLTNHISNKCCVSGSSRASKTIGPGSGMLPCSTSRASSCSWLSCRLRPPCSGQSRAEPVFLLMLLICLYPMQPCPH